MVKRDLVLTIDVPNVVLSLACPGCPTWKTTIKVNRPYISVNRTPPLTGRNRFDSIRFASGPFENWSVRPELFGRVVARSGSVRFRIRFRPVPKSNGSVRFGRLGSVSSSILFLLPSWYISVNGTHGSFLIRRHRGHPGVVLPLAVSTSANH